MHAVWRGTCFAVPWCPVSCWSRLGSGGQIEAFSLQIGSSLKSSSASVWRASGTSSPKMKWMWFLGVTRDLWSPSCAEWTEVVLLTMIGFFCKFLISEAWMCLTCFFNVWTHCTYGEEQKGLVVSAFTSPGRSKELVRFGIGFHKQLALMLLGLGGFRPFFLRSF